MNRKGFTLVELLAVLVVLGIVVGITIPSINGVMNASKAKSEEAFIETIKDAMDIYMSDSEKKSLSYNTTCSDGITKMAQIPFQNIINSSYSPISQGSLMNPGNDLFCTGNNDGKNVIQTLVTIYYNTSTHVYYYKINKSDFYGVDTLKTSNGNLKKGTSTKSCFKYTTDKLYISNLKNPESFKCS